MNNHSKLARDIFFVPEIYITGKCNQDCLFCSASANKQSCYIKEKAFAGLKKELERIRRSSQIVKITGGEATLRPDFLQIVTAAKDLGFKNIIIESNGQNFSSKDLCRATVRAGGNLFFLSIHGPNSAIHDGLVRKRGAFERTKAGISNLKKLGQKVAVNIVINSANYKHLSKIVKLLNGLKADLITFSFIMSAGEAAGQKKLIPQMTEIIPYLEKAVQGAKAKVDIEHFPFCVLGRLNEQNSWVRFRKEAKAKKRFEKKTKDCLSCRFEPVCFGIDQKYLEIYGPDEFRPIAGSKIKNGETYFKKVLARFK